MSHYSKIFNKVPVDIPNKSGFDLSHENLFTAKCGTLYPVLVDTLLPNDTISLGQSCQVQLPPMATDFYGRVMAKFEAFFVPFRIIYRGWQDLITHPVANSNYVHANDIPRYLPSLILPAGSFGPGTLSDFLGIKSLVSSESTTFTVKNSLPFVAYHKIYDDWYRDSRIQKPAFQSVASLVSGTDYSDFGTIPFKVFSGSSAMSFSANNLYCCDLWPAYELRQRNWERDYFTNATPQPQSGDPAQLAFSVSDSKGSFTIASLRAANSLQQWLERNNLAGYRYADQIKAQFGCYPADAITDRCIYLGSSTVDIYNRSVYQTNNMADGASGPEIRNPFASVATKYGSPQAVGQSSLVDKFTATEHGFIFVMFSIVPRAYYGSGCRRYLGYSSSADFAFPILAGVGDQPIYKSELLGGVLAPNTAGTFGYTQRFSEYKYMDDEVHGLLQDGQALDSFALKRTFHASDNVSLGSEFLQIPTDFLDDVAAVNESVSSYGAWCDVYFPYKKVSTLPAYSIPTLGDMKDTHTEVIDNGGKRL